MRYADIDLYVDGQKLKSLTLTTKHTWYYNDFPYNNTPGIKPHRFYDHVRTLLDKTYPAGTKVKVQVSSTDKSPTFTIDVADFELVGPPLAKPSGAISVTDAPYNCDPTGKVDATKAFQTAVDNGKNNKKTVYIPKGNYLLTDHIIIDQVKIIGAGPWYSVVGGRYDNVKHKSVGFFGKYNEPATPGGSKNVYLENFAIIGRFFTNRRFMR